MTDVEPYDDDGSLQPADDDDAAGEDGLGPAEYADEGGPALSAADQYTFEELSARCVSTRMYYSNISAVDQFSRMHAVQNKSARPIGPALNNRSLHADGSVQGVGETCCPDKRMQAPIIGRLFC